MNAVLSVGSLMMPFYFLLFPFHLSLFLSCHEVNTPFNHQR
jgi:hypothetical protein